MNRSYESLSKLLGIICVSILFGAFIFFIKPFFTRKNEVGTIKVGVIQTISHPALDRARDGFTTKLKSLMPEAKFDFVYQNAEGSVPQLYSIAKSLQKKCDLFFAIATPAVQAISSLEKKKPIIFSAVTDAEKAGLIAENICGVCDMIDIEKQTDLLFALAKKLERVGICYNPGEVNSTLMAEEMKKSVEARGKLVNLIGVSQESELLAAFNSSIRKVDALLIPLDNLLVGAMPLVADKARQQHKPLIVSDNPSVERGALACNGVDYYQNGEEAAELAKRILIQGEKAGAIGVTRQKTFSLVINRQTADLLIKADVITISDDLAQQARFV